MNTPRRIAIATCAALPTLDADDAPLLQALEKHNVDYKILVWDDPSARFAESDLVIVRTTWDYWLTEERRRSFVDWATRLNNTVPVLNEPVVLAENTHKSYLRRLEAEGVPVVPTLWLAPKDDSKNGIERISSLGWSEVVIKPAVSAGSAGALRVNATAEPEKAIAHIQELLKAGEVLVQPFLRSIETEGERSILFFDQKPSHAVQKIPSKGDFRSQPEFHSEVAAIAISKEMLDVANQALASFGESLLYGRVDLVRRDDGALAVIEVELTEPSLYLRWDEAAAERFVAAIRRRLDSER